MWVSRFIQDKLEIKFLILYIAVAADGAGGRSRLCRT